MECRLMQPNITCHTPPIDIIIKEREEKYGLKK